MVMMMMIMLVSLRGNENQYFRINKFKEDENFNTIKMK
jgi:hypothetical protein